MKSSFQTVATNREILELAKDNPNFKTWTADDTVDLFSTAGYESMAYTDINKLVSVFDLLARVYLGKIRKPVIKNVSPFNAIVERMSNPEGALQQRIRTHVMKPTNPKYKGQTSGDGVSDLIQRFPTVEEEFYTQNFDYGNNWSMQDFELKKAFLDEAGISEFLNAVLDGVDAGKILQEETLIEEVFSKILTGTVENPLQDTQKIEVPEIDTSDDDVDNKIQTAFLNIFQNFATMINNTRLTGAFNCKKWKHSTNTSDYVLFIRADVYNYIKTHLLANTYHIENLGLPFEIVPVINFGGITYKKTIEGTATAMVPVYATEDYREGEVLGLNADGDPDKTIYQPEDCDIIVDPYADVDAVLVEKGAIFISDQHTYSIESRRNARSRVTNYFAALPDRMIGYDGSHNVIKFYHTTTTTTKKSDSKKADKVEK